MSKAMTVESYDPAKLAKELYWATGLSPKEGQEDSQEFLLELAKEGGAVADAIWEGLSPVAKAWINTANYRNDHGESIQNFDDTEAMQAVVQTMEEAEKEAKETKVVKTPTKTKALATVKSNKAPAAKSNKAPATAKSGGKKAAATPVAKAAKPAAKPAKTAAKTTNGSGRGRPGRFTDQSRIKVLVEKPFREGSFNANVFKLYKNGMTVADFEKKCLAAGGLSEKSTPKRYLSYAMQRGFVAVE